MSHEKMDDSIKESRQKVMGRGRKRRTHFLLWQFLAIMLCGLLVLSGTQERLSLLYIQKNNNNNSNFIFISNFLFCFFCPEHELLESEESTTRSMQTLCSDLGGLGCRAAWRQGWLAQGCWDQKTHSQSVSSAPFRWESDLGNSASHLHAQTLAPTKRLVQL